MREPSPTCTRAHSRAAALTPSPGASPAAPRTCPAAPRSPSAWPPPAWSHACVGPGPPPVLTSPTPLGGRLPTWAGRLKGGGRCWAPQGPAQASTPLDIAPASSSPSEEAGGCSPGAVQTLPHGFCDTRGGGNRTAGCRTAWAQRVEPVTPTPQPRPRSPPSPGPSGCTAARPRSAPQAAVEPRAQGHTEPGQVSAGETGGAVSSPARPPALPAPHTTARGGASAPTRPVKPADPQHVKAGP